jgi:hypothetical protein
MNDLGMISPSKLVILLFDVPIVAFIDTGIADLLLVRRIERTDDS